MIARTFFRPTRPPQKNARPGVINITRLQQRSMKPVLPVSMCMALPSRWWSWSVLNFSETYKPVTSLQKHHLSGLAQRTGSNGPVFVIQRGDVQTVEIDAGGQVVGVELDILFSLVEVRMVDECCDLLPEDVEDAQGHHAASRQVETDRRRRIERVGIILVQRERRRQIDLVESGWIHRGRNRAGKGPEESHLLQRSHRGVDQRSGKGKRIDRPLERRVYSCDDGVHADE